MDFEEEAEDEEMEETSSMASRAQTPGTSVLGSDEYMGMVMKLAQL